MKTNKKTYMTKRIKTQFLYYKIIFGAVMASTIVIGLLDTNTRLYIESTANIPTVHAKTIEEKLPETVEEQIRRIAKETNFKWPNYLVKLANCESRLDPNTLNNNGLKLGIDRGVFQISDKFHPEVSNKQAFNVDYATRWTIDQINKGRQSWWMCDKIILNK